MGTYRLRPATLDDVDVLTQHRLGMFSDMGLPIDREAMAAAFGRWLTETMPAGVYRAWVVEDAARVVGGGGLTILPWPPGPQSHTGTIGYVFNVYTDPPHRQRGVGRMVMTAIHDWSREHGIDCVRLNASTFGRPLYESLGYAPIASLTMQIKLD